MILLLHFRATLVVTCRPSMAASLPTRFEIRQPAPTGGVAFK